MIEIVPIKEAGIFSSLHLRFISPMNSNKFGNTILTSNKETAY